LVSFQSRVVCQALGRELRFAHSRAAFRFDTPAESGSFSFIRFDNHATHHSDQTALVRGLSMNKNDLIGAVAESSGLSKTDAANAVEGVFDAITKALSSGDEVRLVGFGTFSVAKRKASTGRNPRTGEPMTIKASTQPKFKAGKGLKDAVN
jgi:DNA-binding protein HU-beta